MLLLLLSGVLGLRFRGLDGLGEIHLASMVDFVPLELEFACLKFELGSEGELMEINH